MMGIQVFHSVSKIGSRMQWRELDWLDYNSSQEVLLKVAGRMHGPELRDLSSVSALEDG